MYSQGATGSLTSLNKLRLKKEADSLLQPSIRFSVIVCTCMAPESYSQPCKAGEKSFLHGFNLYSHYLAGVITLKLATYAGNLLLSSKLKLNSIEIRKNVLNTLRLRSIVNGQILTEGGNDCQAMPKLCDHEVSGINSNWQIFIFS